MASPEAASRGWLTPELRQAKRTPWGGQRFFAPGEHPATARYRDQLRRLEALGASDSEAAEYVRDFLAAFEEDESAAKQIHLRMARG